MCAVVSIIENDRIFVIDEIQIWSSNTNEMCEEIKRRYEKKVIVILQHLINH